MNIPALLFFFRFERKTEERMDELTEIRCPKCRKLLGRFDGRGEMPCPRCRSNTPLIRFDTRLTEGGISVGKEKA